MSNPIFTNEVAYKAYLLQEYVKDGGNHCPSPICRSPNIEAGSYNAEGGEISYEIVCTECGSVWNDVHALSHATGLVFGYEREDINE